MKVQRKVFHFNRKLWVEFISRPNKIWDVYIYEKVNKGYSGLNRILQNVKSPRFVFSTETGRVALPMSSEPMLVNLYAATIMKKYKSDPEDLIQKAWLMLSKNEKKSI